MIPRFALLPAFLLLLRSTYASEPEPECECYTTSTSNLFTNRTFDDFRELTSLPSTWSAQSWHKNPNNLAPFYMLNLVDNIFIDDGKLVLKTMTDDDGSQLTAEAETVDQAILYASARLRLRVSGASGACAGVFFYHNDHNESDIEILTRDDPSVIRYSNQPVLDDDGETIPGASAAIDLSNGTTIANLEKRGADAVRWDEWHTHRIDWVEGLSSWYVDGVKMHDTTYGVPTVPSYFVLNMWGDGGEWSGEMEPEQEARMEVEWVEMVFNVSGLDVGEVDEKKCCVLDAEEGDVAEGGYELPSMAAAHPVKGMFIAVVGIVVGMLVL